MFFLEVPNASFKSVETLWFGLMPNRWVATACATSWVAP